MAKIDEVLTEIQLLKSWLYGDGDGGHVGDITEIKNDIKAINGCIKNNDEVLAKHEAKLQEHDGFFKAMPFNKKWFWTLLVILILGLAGVGVPDLINLLNGLGG